MAKSVTIHHPKLGRQASVPSRRVARVMATKGWVEGQLPKSAPAKATKAAVSKEQANG